MNHSRVDLQASAISCGITQISRISDDIKDVLFAIGTRFYHAAHGQPPALAIWSNLADVETNGHRLAAVVMDLKLGTITVTTPQINPNTGAIICMWTWNINHEVFKEWYKQTKVKKLETQYPRKE